MYGSNNMKKSVVFNNQFTPKLGGQFELENGGQFAPELVVNLNWKVVVNLTGFSTMFRFGSIKRLVFSNSKVLTKNTTWMGGDFLSNLKGLALLLR
jgi:hypothetical protein